MHWLLSATYSHHHLVWLGHGPTLHDYTRTDRGNDVGFAELSIAVVTHRRMARNASNPAGNKQPEFAIVDFWPELPIDLFLPIKQCGGNWPSLILFYNGSEIHVQLCLVLAVPSDEA
jgi:hypothetical protein